MLSFHTYSDAKKAGDTLVKDLAKGKQRVALTEAQALDALAAIERLRDFERETGRKLSLLACVSEFAESAKALPNGHSMREAIEGFGRSVVSVKRVPIQQAIEEFIAFRKVKTVRGQWEKTPTERGPLEKHWLLA
jgi:hypothetical protein